MIPVILGGLLAVVVFFVVSYLIWAYVPYRTWMLDKPMKAGKPIEDPDDPQA